MGWVRMASQRHPELRRFHHIPNGGGRSKAEAGRFKAMGVKSGVSDYCLPVARGGFFGLYLEMKPAPYRTTGGRIVQPRPSAEQKKWIEESQDHGYLAVVCWGWHAAAEQLSGYVTLKPTKVSA